MLTPRRQARTLLLCLLLRNEICKRHQRCHTRISGTTRPNILYGLPELSCFGHVPSRERRSLQDDWGFMLHLHPHPDGSVTKASHGLLNLSIEFAENSGVYDPFTSCLEDIFGQWSAWVTSPLTTLTIIVIAFVVVGCCVLPCIRRILAKSAKEVIPTMVAQNVQSQFAVANEYTVDGTADQSATLPCKLTIPSNWKDDELHVMWFKNFTEKLWDCRMKIEKAPNCQQSPKSSQTQISRNHFGDVALEISVLQESDAGRYQCWILMSDTYLRTDVLLRVHRLRSHGLGKDNSAQWMGSVVTPFSWTIVLPSGWLLAIFLAVVLLWQRLCVSKRKTQILLSR